MRARNLKERGRSSAVVKSFPSRKAERGDGQAAFVVLIQSHKATRGSHALLWSPTLSSVCKDKKKMACSNDCNTEQSERKKIRARAR